MSGYGKSGGFSRSRDDGGTSEMHVPAEDCGKIIGRGGSRIRELQDSSRCKIRVCPDDDGRGIRRVELRGSEEAIDMAVDMINQILENSDGRDGRGNPSYGGSYGGGGGSGKDTIRVDSSCVGRIIGKGGCRIRELQDETGCRINVSHDGGRCGQTEVELIGSRSAILHAKDRIDNITSPSY